MTATMRPLGPTLTLSMTARDTSEDDKTKTIYLDVDQALAERLRDCVVEGGRLNAWVTLVLPGGIEDGATSSHIEVRVMGDGQMDFRHERRAGTAKTITYATGSLSVSMIEEALEKVSAFAGQAGIGIVPDTCMDILLVDRERVEKIDGSRFVIRNKPGDNGTTMASVVDSVIHGPEPAGMNGALHVFIEDDRVSLN